MTMSDPRSERAAEIQDSIRRVLFHDWDPLRVGDNLNLRDDYDSYIASVYRILSGSRSEPGLIGYLFRTERDAMELSCQSPDHLRPVARKLLHLNVSS